MRLETVAVFTNRFEADVALARLKSEGIEGIVMTDAAAGMEPQFLLTRGVEIQVRPPDAEDARIVLGIDQPVDRLQVDPIRQARIQTLTWWIVAVLVLAVGFGLLRVF